MVFCTKVQNFGDDLGRQRLEAMSIPPRVIYYSGSLKCGGA